MNKILEIMNIKDPIHLPNRVMEILNSDQRDSIFKELSLAHNNDFSYCWFQSMYEELLANTKQHEQFFTPFEICKLTTGLVTLSNNSASKIHEPSAGIGGMIINLWWEHARNHHDPFTYRPSEHIVDCWDISDRAIPILLLNLSIRGIEGVVTHGNTIENEVYNKYVLINEQDSFMSYSDIYKIL